MSDYPVYRSAVDNLTDGEQRRVRLTKSGAQRVSMEDVNGAPIAGGGDASAANQTNGNQKTQIVGPAGAVPTVGNPAATVLGIGENALTVRGFGYYLNPANNNVTIALGDGSGLYTTPGILPAGTDRSGTVGTTAATLAPANALRRKLTVQNLSTTATLYVNQLGGTAVAGAAGTHSIPPQAERDIVTNRAISVIASAAATAFTAIEV